MGFFNKIKEFSIKISEVENSIYGGKTDYLEMYERNQLLEKEIEQRTKELSIANKRMLTLQHILDMMNSAKPLQSVLENIVNSIQGELGYLHSNIIKLDSDEKGEYMFVVAQSKDVAIQRINDIIHDPMQKRRLAFNPESFYAEAIREKKIVQTRNFEKALKYIIPDLEENLLQSAVQGRLSKSIIIIPLYTRNKPFGLFCVFSSRDDLTETETNFLSTYAQQIEVAITIADLFETVKSQAVTDSLTGLYNRRYFEECLSREVMRAQRQNQPFSIIGLDLDFLKKINDVHGHAYGDLAIKTIADILKKNARSIDIAARMGGEEFNVLLPGIDSNGAMIAAERMRKAVENQELETIGHITASVGVATYLEHSDNIDEVMELTDQAMYLSKRNGRNQVTLAKPITETSWQEIAMNTFIDILSKHNVPVDTNISEEICQKLQNSNQTKDALYMAADMINSIYNPLHSNGIMKSKVLLAVSLAKRFDLSKEEIDNLRIATLLYDIGNLMLPKEILLKRGPLTDVEHSKMQEHPIIAAREILKPISYIQDVIPIIEHHHENWDGTGYPGKISKEEIPMTSQIILIVDAYFALTEQRPYRAKLSPKEAVEIIKKDAGKKWNLALVQEFVSLIDHDLN